MQTALAALLYRLAASEPEGIFVPTRVGGVRLHRPASDWPEGDVHAFARIGPPSTASLTGSVTALDADGRPLLSIDDVVVERVAADAQHDELAEWGYEARWRLDPAPATDRGPAGPGSADGWVVLADTGGVTEAWLARRTGQPQCVRRFDEQNAPRGADSFAWLEALDLAKCPGILCLWPLDTPSIASTDGEAVLGAQRRGVATVVALAQAVARRAGPRPRIWVATRGAQAVTAADAVAGLEHASVWGLAAAVAREHPRAWGGIIDLDPEMAPDMAAVELDRLLRSGRGEDQVALRGGKLYVRRLVRAPLQPMRDQLRVSRDGTYLIAGGLGGLGLAVARWLVERGARHLLLLGRSTPDADDARLADLGASGATVHFRTVDVGNAAELQRLLRDWQASDSPAIRGVVHAAGIFQDQLLEAITPEDLDSGLRAKIVGAHTLDRVLGDHPLDFFVLFSSFSGLVPPPGQAVYAAACAFLDGLAEQRRAAGRTALSVAWGAWSEVGFAATEYGQRAHARLEDAGMKRIAPSRGVQVLERLLGGDPPARVGILPFDLAALVSNDELLARMPVMRDLLGETQRSVPATAFLAALNDRDLDGQRRLVLDAMRGMVAAILKQRLEHVDVDAPLIDLGLASLAALQLKNRVARDIGLEMSLADALRGASIATLAERLLTDLRIDSLRAAEPLVGTVGDKEGPREEFVL
jgi:NAD(P)-dependent dehydrogenase (short-subunit alcohol dehydrogenase family)/aryl carrier-like protein